MGRFVLVRVDSGSIRVGSGELGQSGSIRGSVRVGSGRFGSVRVGLGRSMF